MKARTRGIVIGAAAVTVAVVVGVGIWLASSPAPPPDSTPQPSATSAPRDETAVAQDTLDEHLEQCTALGAVGGAVPEGCGIRIPWGTEFAAVADARFRVDRLPVLRLTDGDGFIAEDGVLVATVTGTGQDGAPRTETYRTESWTVRGDVVSTGDDVELSVW